MRMDAAGTRIGTEIAGFRIESVLGRGGMSIVYLAEQMRLGRKVALKLLASELVSRDESFRERFLRESHLAAQLDHPNIIPIYDAGEAEGCLYIAMRYIDGPDLGQIIEQQGSLSLGRTIYILEQVANALDVAHADGLVHRDVKPANILIVGASDRVYLTDFGVAKPTTSAGLTRTGFFIGTPDYCAPEQIEGRPVDARTDVYALGGVLYACLTGSAPYARDTEVAVLQAHLLEPAPKLTDRRPDLPRGFNNVLASAMAKARDDRYPSCGEMMAAARAASLERPLSLPPVESTIINERPGAQPTAVSPDSVAPPAPATPTDVAPSAATAPPAPPPQEVTARRRFRPNAWLVVAILAIAVGALGAALAIALATRGGGGGHSASPATSAGTSPATTEGGSMPGMQKNKQGSGLYAMLPSDVPTKSCKQAASDHPGGLATLNCDFTDNQSRRILLHVDAFRNKTFLYGTYRDHGVANVKAGGGTPDPQLKTDTGECTGTAWLGEGSWSHEPGGPSAGRRACFIVPGNSKLCKPTGASACSVIVWTSDLSNLFMRAVLPSTVHRSLFIWWRFHAHLFG